MDPIIDSLDLPQAVKFSFSPRGSKPTLEMLMKSDQREPEWKSTCHWLGGFLAEIAFSSTKSSIDKNSRKNLQPKNRLLSWLQENLAHPDESILSVLPQRLKHIYNDGVDRTQSFGAQLGSLASAPKFPTLHDDRSLTNRAKICVEKLQNELSCAVLQNVRSDMIYIHGDETYKVDQADDYCTTYGPLELQLSINMADLFVLYYQMTRKFRVCDVVMAQICNDLGKSFLETYKQLEPGFDQNEEQFWKWTSFFTGWEIIRRCHTEDNVPFAINDNTDCVEAGLRLCKSTNVDSVGKMTFIGFALC